MSLGLLHEQLREALATLEVFQSQAISASSQSDDLVKKNKALEDEVESLRLWKASASTTIQFLQQQAMQRSSAPCGSLGSGVDGQPVVLDGVSTQSQDCGGSTRNNDSPIDLGNAVFSPVTDVAPTIASNDSTGSVTAASPTISEPPLNTRAHQGDVLVAQREALDAAKLRIKALEEELMVVKARWAAAETRCNHQRHVDSTALSSALRTSRGTELDSLKDVIIESASDLRDALTTHSGALALPLLPHTALDISLLVVTLRDHCKMAARRLRVLESLE